MTEWRDVALGELVTVKHGYAFKGEFFAPTGDEIVLTPGNFPVGGGLQFRSGKERYYTGRYPEEFRLRPGELVVVMTDLKQDAPILGSPAFVPLDPPVLHNQRLGLVTPKQGADVDVRYLYYLLLCERTRSQLRATATGSTVRHTAPDRMYRVMVRLPPRVVQETIGSALGSIDDLIENNRRRIEVLEQMAQAIYREWFVHFRFPGHEDTTFVDSPLGPIPEGWEVRQLREVATVVRGRSYRKSELVETGGVPFVNLKCMRRGGGFRHDGLKRFEGKHSVDQRVRPGDIVLAVTDLTQGREILARATLVPRLSDAFGVISLDVVRLVPQDPRDRLALLLTLNATDFPDRVKEFANGSTVLHLSPEHVANGLISWPALRLRRRLVDSVEPILSIVEDLREASVRLAAIRDLLLPKLVSGEIDVSSLDLDAHLTDRASMSARLPVTPSRYPDRAADVDQEVT